MSSKSRSLERGIDEFSHGGIHKWSLGRNAPRVLLACSYVGDNEIPEDTNALERFLTWWKKQVILRM